MVHEEVDAFRHLAYVPLDVPGVEIEYQTLDEFMQTWGRAHFPYGDLWHALAVIGRIGNFDDAKECDDAWNRRYEPGGEIRCNPHLHGPLKEQLLSLIKTLPYERCTFAQILSQKRDVVAHQDGLYDVAQPVKVALAAGAIGFNGEPEPAGLKVMLSHQNERSFFVSQTKGSKKNFIQIPETTHAFAINERTFWHGAKAPQGRKYVLSTFGKIDPVMHKKLIAKSLEKYSDYSIWF